MPYIPNSFWFKRCTYQPLFQINFWKYHLIPPTYLLSLLIVYCISSKNLHDVLIYLLYTILRSLHSRKEDILGFLAKMVEISSRVIFFFSLSGWASYHFWRRSLPCRLNNNINCIWRKKNNGFVGSFIQNYKKETTSKHCVTRFRKQTACEVTEARGWCKI